MVLQRGNITISDDFIITTPNPIKEPTEGIGCTIYTHMQNHKSQVAQVLLHKHLFDHKFYDVYLYFRLMPEPEKKTLLVNSCNAAFEPLSTFGTKI